MLSKQLVEEVVSWEPVCSSGKASQKLDFAFVLFCFSFGLPTVPSEVEGYLQIHECGIFKNVNIQRSKPELQNEPVCVPVLFTVTIFKPL